MRNIAVISYVTTTWGMNYLRGRGVFPITEIAQSVFSSVIAHCLNALGIVKKAPTGYLRLLRPVIKQYPFISIACLRFLYEPL